MQKFTETRNFRHIFRNELNKACLSMIWCMKTSKIYQEKTAFDKVLRDKAFKIAINPKCDGYQHVLESMVCKFFDKKAVDTITFKGTEFISEDQQLAMNYTGYWTKKFQRRKVH